MAGSKATTVPQFLDELQADRRAVIEDVLDLVRRNLPAGYEETVAWGMVTWSVPLERYPATYNKQPLAYLALAAQKNYNSLYVMSAADGSPQLAQLREGFAAAGKKLDMGKSCVRFKQPSELPADVIADVVASQSVDEFIAQYEQARGIER